MIKLKNKKGNQEKEVQKKKEQRQSVRETMKGKSSEKEQTIRSNKTHFFEISHVVLLFFMTYYMNIPILRKPRLCVGKPPSVLWTKWHIFKDAYVYDQCTVTYTYTTNAAFCIGRIRLKSASCDIRNFLRERGIQYQVLLKQLNGRIFLPVHPIVLPLKDGLSCNPSLRETSSRIESTTSAVNLTCHVTSPRCTSILTANNEEMLVQPVLKILSMKLRELFQHDYVQ